MAWKPSQSDRATAVALCAGTLLAGCIDTSGVDYDIPDLGVAEDADVQEPDAIPLDLGFADTSEDAEPDIPFRPDVVTPTPTLDEISTEIFRPVCGQCHVDRVSGGLSLRSGDGLLDRLLAPSLQAPEMPRVTFGDRGQSYMWRKVNGTHIGAGGSGDEMPIGGELDATQLEMLRRWIEETEPAAD